MRITFDGEVVVELVQLVIGHEIPALLLNLSEDAETDRTRTILFVLRFFTPC